MFDHFRRKFFGLLSILMLCMALPSLAGAWVTVKGDGDRWMKFGAGLRASYQTTSDSSLDARGGDIALEDMRLYTLTQVHKNIVFEFNTEVRSKADNDPSDYTDNSFHDMYVLDARATLTVQGFDIWFGKFLPPSERSNLDGPYFLNVWDFPLATSPYPAIAAGRDQGVMIYKEYDGGKFKWAYGAFEGRKNATNGDTNPDENDNFQHGFRATYNFWAPEPGYYTTSAYYGAKDVLAVAFVARYEEDGAGTGLTNTTQGDYFGWSVDVLMEKKLSSGAVVNLEASYYDTDTDDIDDGTITQGNAYRMLASYMLPNKVGWGKFQPYVRYQHASQDQCAGANCGGTNFGTRGIMEGGLNYIIDGHNAKIMSSYISDKQSSNAEPIHRFILGMQFQLL
ncbi:MAG: porin [Nitrospinota bacterium]|nr:porin [Nitrospinota bacterium]